MTTFVLVHGGGHGGWCWKPVAGLLRAKGHDVHAPTLTGLGERRHLVHAGVTLDTHIEDVAALLFHQDLREIILVGHSYGGMVITGVADRALDRIARLVYLDAAIPHDGEALVDCSPGLRAFNDAREVDGVCLGLWPDSAATSIYGLTDPELAAWALPRLAPHPWRTFEQPLRLAHAGAVAALPRAIVNCTESLRRRDPGTRHRWLEGDHVCEVDMGHDLMLTEPEAVAAMLIDIASL